MWKIARMPSRRHELLARVVPRSCASPASSTPRRPSGPGSRSGTPPSTAASRRVRCRCSAGATPWSARSSPPLLGRGFPAYTLTRRGSTPSRTVVYLHGGGFVGPIDPYQVRYAARLASALGRPGGDAGLPADARAHLASTRTSRSSTWSSGCWTSVGRRGAGRRLGRRRPGARRRADPARPRRPAAVAPAADLALGRPDHQHARDPRGHQGRPVAVHRQDAGVRRVVGRLARRPRPARGLARPRRPGRAAAGADVLRHPRLALAGRAAAGPPGRGGRLAAHLRRGAGADPRLPDPAVPPRGRPRVAADAGVPRRREPCR